VCLYGVLFVCVSILYGILFCVCVSVKFLCLVWVYIWSGRV